VEERVSGFHFFPDFAVGVVRHEDVIAAGGVLREGFGQEALAIGFPDGFGRHGAACQQERATETTEREGETESEREGEMSEKHTRWGRQVA
jgi:hypothetical protein